MKRLVLPTVIGLMFSASSSAAVFLTSENPAQMPGVVTYNGNYPTPFNDPLANINVPSAQNTFTTNDDIRAAFMLDLGALNPFMDEGTGGYANGLMDVHFMWYKGADEVTWNYIDYGWDEIEDLQTTNDTLSIWTDSWLSDSGLLSAGDWSVYAFVEENFVGGYNFSVENADLPAPATWASFMLLSLGAVAARRQQKNK